MVRAQIIRVDEIDSFRDEGITRRPGLAESGRLLATGCRDKSTFELGVRIDGIERGFERRGESTYAAISWRSCTLPGTLTYVRVLRFNCIKDFFLCFSTGGHCIPRSHATRLA